MHKPKNFYLWLLALSLILPILELIVFAIIYESLLEFALVISASFIPISIISGIFLLYLLMCTRNRSGKRYVFLGYIISLFATIAVSVMLQKLPPWLIANVIGGIILLGGTFLAYLTRPKNNPFYI